jgi:hypothetical protein
MKKTSTSGDASVHYNLQDVPGYAAAVARLQAINAARVELQTKLDGISQKLQGLPRGKEAVTYAARRLLSGDLQGPAEVKQMTEDLRSLQEQLQVYTEAERLQQEAVEEQRTEASRSLCQKAFPEHRELVLRMLKAFEQLSEAYRQERAFCDGMRQRGISVVHPIRDNPLGDRISHLHETYRSELKQFGYLD